MATHSHGRGRTHLKEEEQKHRRDKSSGRTGYKGGDNQVVYQEAFFPHKMYNILYINCLSGLLKYIILSKTVTFARRSVTVGHTLRLRVQSEQKF